MPDRFTREASHADYEELRAHVVVPRPASLEPRTQHVENRPVVADAAKISVIERLLSVGNQVVRRLRGSGRVSSLPLTRIHGR